MYETKRIGWTVYKKRMSILLAGIILIFILLAARLFYIQVMCSDNLSAGADSQQKIAVMGLDTRGVIYDRNMVPLVGGKKKYYYFVPTSAVDGTLMSMMEAVSASDVTGTNSNSLYKVYCTGLYNPLISRRMKEEYGAYILMMKSRYADSQTACHLIGYINEDEGRGVSGLELACEEILYSEKDEYYLTVDGAGSILKGVAPVKLQDSILDEAKSSSVITTIDSDIQKTCEEILKSDGMTGAIMVSDLNNGEILAWASSPTFNPNSLEEYIESDGDSLLDKCIQGCYPPGSVFKVVVAAAALEGNLVDPLETLDCTGTVEVNGVELGCAAGPKDGHGEVDMYEAMAVSCNCYFARLGEKIGTDAVIDMAEKMGMGSKVFDIFDGESGGYLPSHEEVGSWDVSNISIGQGELLATPAQVHRMMSIIANGGVLQQLKVIDSDKQTTQRVISEKTAVQLEQMLANVMENGTGAGTYAKINYSTKDNLKIYGKTGTSETSIDGEFINQCWFSGYLKTDKKGLLITVLIEDGVSGRTSALPVFEKIASKSFSTY